MNFLKRIFEKTIAILIDYIIGFIQYLVDKVAYFLGGGNERGRLSATLLVINGFVFVISFIYVIDFTFNISHILSSFGLIDEPIEKDLSSHQIKFYLKIFFINLFIPFVNFFLNWKEEEEWKKIQSEKSKET